MEKQPNNSEFREHYQEKTTDPNSSSAGGFLGENLLSQILRSSEQSMGETDSERLSEFEDVFLSIASKHQNVQQLDVSILSELVSELVSDIPNLTSPLSDQLVEWVTGVLYNDSRARGRLERLWVQLNARLVDGK